MVDQPFVGMADPGGCSCSETFQYHANAKDYTGGGGFADALEARRLRFASESNGVAKARAEGYDDLFRHARDMGVDKALAGLDGRGIPGP